MGLEITCAAETLVAYLLETEQGALGLEKNLQTPNYGELTGV